MQLAFILGGHNATILFGSVADLARDIVLILTGTFNYAMPLGHPTLRIFWSLCVEEHFYLIVPLALVVAGTRSRRLIACIGAIALVVLVMRPATADFGGGRAYSHAQFDSLFAGVFLALVTSREKDARQEPLVMPLRFVKWALVPGCVVLLATDPRCSTLSRFIKSDTSRSGFFHAFSLPTRREMKTLSLAFRSWGAHLSYAPVRGAQ